MKFLHFGVPGKVMLNGGYIVLDNEPCVAVTIDSYLNVTVYKTDISNKIEFELNDKKYEFLLNDKNTWIHENKHADSKYIAEILNNTFVDLKCGLKIKGIFDDGFFTKNNCKTGIGSSSCMLVAFVYIHAHLKCIKENRIFDRNEFIERCLIITKIINVGSSGYDAISCASGCVIYSLSRWSKFVPKEKYLVLGSFGSSTSSRDMIKKIKVDEKWNNLKEINKRLLKDSTLYEEYVDELRNISRLIVPDEQYDLIKKTFRLGIKQCGVAGAGGEDAIWAMTDDTLELVDLWKATCDYVRVCKITNGGVFDLLNILL